MTATVTRAAFAAALESAPDVTELLLALLPADDARLLRRCALPRRFDQRLLDSVLRPDAGVPADLVPFERLTSLPGVGPEPGRPGWYRLGTTERTAHEAAWHRAAAGTIDGGEALGEARFRALNARLAEWFADAGPGGELEALYHRLVADPARAGEQFYAAYTAAAEAFDLARCESLLDVLDQREKFLPPVLATYRTEARGLLRARGAVANDYYRTARHLERPELVAAFESVVKDGGPFILHLHGPGGRGKTMFLRWLAARYCLPRNIPTARIDFDFLDESEAGLAPRFFFGKLADQLNPQLPGQPFLELLDIVLQMRRTATARQADSRAGPGRSADGDEQEVAARFATVLEESHRGPVVLMFDTLEDAALKHRVDVLAIIRAIDDIRSRMAAQASKLGRTPPRLVVILAGRYTLDEQYKQVAQDFRAGILTREVEPFSPEEARVYLTVIRGVAPSDAVEAAIRRAAGSPIALALYADIFTTSPRITREEIEHAGSVDMFYLVERVLRRIPDDDVRWTLRYGVVARRLTRRFVEDVLGPHLERAVRGNLVYDDPHADRVRDDRWPALWRPRADGARARKLRYDQLWKRLRKFASPSSWVQASTDGATEALSFQSAVTHPMRRVLRAQPIFRQLHRDAVQVYRRRVEQKEEPLHEHLAELTHHEFQLRGPKAAAAWRARLQEYSWDDDARRSLAAVVLSEDLRETEAAVNGEAAGTLTGDGALVPPAVEARAYFELAALAHEKSKQAAGEQRQRQLADARAHLQAFDAIKVRVRSAAVPLASEAKLRWDLAADPQSEGLALGQLAEAEKRRLPEDERASLLLTLERAFSARDPTRAESYARKSAALARRQGKPEEYAESVRTLLAYERSRGAYLKALGECSAAISALSARGERWSPRKHASEEARALLRVRSQLEGESGLVSSALEHAVPPARSSGARRSAGVARATLLLERVRLLLRDDRPVAAAEAAAEAAHLLDSLPRRKQSAAAERRDALNRLQCDVALADARRRLMELGPALDLLQRAMVAAAQIGAHDWEVGLRLRKARVYLHYVGDLRQAAEHLGDSDDALSQESPDLRLEHAMLRASLHDRLGAGDEVERLLRVAEGILPSVTPDPLGQRVDLALLALSMAHVGRRARWLEALRDAVAKFDFAPARLTRLRGLLYCPAVEDTPDSVANDLLRLARLQRSQPRSSTHVPPADRLRLALLRVELLRVLGRTDQAATELRGLRRALGAHANKLRDRDVAHACDRLNVERDAVLPSGWLRQFLGAFRAYPTLCGVALLEEAEREFRSGSAARAREHAEASRERVEHADAIPSVYDARLATLRAGLAREANAPARAVELEGQAERIYEELGDRTRMRQRESLTNARRDEWTEELRRRAGFGVRIQHETEATLFSWVTERPDVWVTPRPIGQPLRELMARLRAGPLSGWASLPLIERLHSAWSELGVLLAQALLPASLRSALAGRLAQWAGGGESHGASDPGEALDVLLECAHPALHGIPWELAVLDDASPRPLALEPGLGHVWRGALNATPSDRVRWAQSALSVVLGRRIVSDGVAGAATTRATREAQQALSVSVTGLLDAPTRIALRDRVRELRPAERERGAVLLVQTQAEYEVVVQRGLSSRGTHLSDIYRRHGFAVDVIDEPDPDWFRNMLRRGRHSVLHFATPLAESRAGNEVFFQLGAKLAAERTATAFGAKHLATLLRSTFSRAPAPLVVVDVPRPPSLDEALRQLVLRNVVASELFLFGRLPAVVATGLAGPDDQALLSDQLAEVLVGRPSPGDVARSIRRADLYGTSVQAHRWSVEAVLPTACVALFARDPNLDPQDLFFGSAE